MLFCRPSHLLSRHISRHCFLLTHLYFSHAGADLALLVSRAGQWLFTFLRISVSRCHARRTLERDTLICSSYDYKWNCDEESKGRKKLTFVSVCAKLGKIWRRQERVKSGEHDKVDTGNRGEHFEGECSEPGSNATEPVAWDSATRRFFLIATCHLLAICHSIWRSFWLWLHSGPSCQHATNNSTTVHQLGLLRDSSHVGGHSKTSLRNKSSL